MGAWTKAAPPMISQWDMIAFIENLRFKEQFMTTSKLQGMLLQSVSIK